MQSVGIVIKTHNNGNTKITGKGNIEVIMNDVVNREIQRQRELERQEHEKKMRECDNKVQTAEMMLATVTKQRNALREEKNEAFIKRYFHKNFMRRIIYKATNLFALMIACPLCWGEALGFVKYNDKKGKWEWERKH